MMPKVINKTPEELIVEHLEANGQTYTWLAKKLDLSVGHLHLVLKGEGENKKALTEANLSKINETLGTNFKA